MKMNKKEMMILAGSAMASMMAGFIIGCMKTKMMDDCKCIIDEM